MTWPLTGIGTYYLEDTGRNWDIDSLVGQYVVMLSGLLAGQQFLIVSNTAERYVFAPLYDGLVNGSFETGAFPPFRPRNGAPWETITNLTARTGSYSVKLFTPDRGHNAELQFVLPAGTTKLGFFYKYQRVGTPSCGGCPASDCIYIYYNQGGSGVPRRYINVGCAGATNPSWPNWDRWEDTAPGGADWTYIGYNPVYFAPACSFTLWIDDVYTRIANYFERGFRVGDYYRLYNPLEGPPEFKPLWSLQIGSV